ncbi:MAG TPA: hypothetical protein VEJ44_04790, partial [Acidimicrobiales bacterium]|nr:hypothetical protein [Acidimicrobiales bacterium]
PRVGLAEPPDAALEPAAPAADTARSGRPPVIDGPPEVAVPDAVPSDNYSMRLVASRTLYDHGAAVAGSPALAALVRAAALRVNPSDLDDLGVAPGGRVRVRTSTAETVVVTAPDPSLPARVVATDFNVPFGESAEEAAEGPGDGAVRTVADLIDVSRPVVELRMETL